MWETKVRETRRVWGKHAQSTLYSYIKQPYIVALYNKNKHNKIPNIGIMSTEGKNVK